MDACGGDVDSCDGDVDSCDGDVNFRGDEARAP